MNNEQLTAFFTDLKLGDAQEHRGLTIYPLLHAAPEKAAYISLARALADKHVLVREVSENGSVPSLYVENTGDSDVLVLDGEELAGAKQNRILNVTILVAARSRLTVPVSCTEQGRWSYARRDFESSGHFATRSVRDAQRRTVSDSLRFSESYASDQGRVWKEVQDMYRRTGVRSHTSAMRDVLDEKRETLAGAATEFAKQDGQRGLLAVTPDGSIGLDFVSRADVYEDLHERLVQSYLFDVLWSRGGGSKESPVETKPEVFLQKLAGSTIETYPAPGKGASVRLHSDEAVGAALEVEGEVVHLGVFSQTPGGSTRPETNPLHRGHRRLWGGR